MKIIPLTAPHIIHEAGAYTMPADAYHADPCPAPSLNQTTAKVLIEQSPAHAREQHPKLNPSYEPKHEDHFDLGTAAHTTILGRGAEIIVCNFDDWRSKDARLQRDAERASGRTPILAKQAERVLNMVDAARRQARIFEPDKGAPETVLAWPEHDIWFRTMIDWIEDGDPWDYKTTDQSIAPSNINRLMVNGGWDIQAAMHERALETLWPTAAPRRKFRFVVQEVSPPYALVVLELPESVMTIGRKKLNYAIDAWTDCIRANTWPGYPTYQTAQYPSYAENQWLEREMREVPEASNILGAG
jgi:hypothetical protein